MTAPATSLTTMTVTTATPLLCPLCAETMSALGRFGALSRPCCGQLHCQSCLYRHIVSVFEEGITGSGRMQLLCPMGCSRPLHDEEIRDCLARQHCHAVWSVFGSLIMYLMQAGICFFGWNHYQDPLQSSRYYESWLYWGRTRAERQDLRRYEQWSLAVALRTMVKESNNGKKEDEQIVQRCPAPDCDYAWLVANPAYRRSKQVHERKKTYLWFAPPKPEPSSDDCNWVQPEYLNMGHGGGGLFALDGVHNSNGKSQSDETSRDGRRMMCANCHVVFCGLCRQPWTSGGRRKSHGALSCRSYRRFLPSANDTEFSFIAAGFGARMCPGCSLRTSRIDGCNHMSCPCGVEWCYVCERRWNPLHYSCVDRPRGNANGGEEASGGICIIS
jgi:hypothetical protein